MHADSFFFDDGSKTNTGNVGGGRTGSHRPIHYTKQKFGKLDTVVNSVGIAIAFKMYKSNKKLPSKLEDFAKVLIVNTMGTFNVIRLAVGLMIENTPNEDGKCGIIINTVNVAAFDEIGQTAYSASKAAVIGMTLPIARDLSKDGIRVVTIAPGSFDTPILQALPDNVRMSVHKTVPFTQRLSKPDEYAQLAQHIIQNPLLNGEVIRLDGALRVQV